MCPDKAWGGGRPRSRSPKGDRPDPAAPGARPGAVGRGAKPPSEFSRGTRALGVLGEEAAARFLARRGFTILERNLRSRWGELDLVARDGHTVVFVEVKARREGAGDPPQAAVDARKQARLARLALAYLARRRLGEPPCRFDVVAVTVDRTGAVQAIRHFPDAFRLDGWSG